MKLKLIVVVMLLATAALAQQSESNRKASQAMISDCRNYTDPESKNYSPGGDYCLGYVTGFIQFAPINDVHCLPADVTAGQLGLVFKKYLEDHPEQVHQPVAVLLRRAVKSAFPCK